MIPSTSKSNNNSSKTASTCPSNKAKTFLRSSKGPEQAYIHDRNTTHMHSVGEEEDQETTSVCSSVSSLTDEGHDHGHYHDDSLIEEEHKVQERASCKPRQKSKFTVTRSTAAVGTTDSVTSAVSISFLGQSRNNLKERQPAKQVIQRALAKLRPGGVFFVLDYKDQDQEHDTAMNEIPEDLAKQWNLTMVPTNLETFYNTRLATQTSKLAPTRTSLPASQRIVRWMGVKPRVSPANN